jgi:hypothetical protein
MDLLQKNRFSRRGVCGRGVTVIRNGVASSASVFYTGISGIGRPSDSRIWDRRGRFACRVPAGGSGASRRYCSCI